MRSVLPAFLSVVVILAGCSESPGAAVPQDERQSGPLGTQPLSLVQGERTAGNTTMAAPSSEDWLLLPLDASIEGSFAGYRFEVPRGASVPPWYDESGRVVIMEVMVVGTGSVEALHVLVGSKGQVVAETTSFASAQGWGASVNERSYSGGVAGEYLEVDVEEGAEFFVAAAVVGTGDTSLGLRYLDADPTASLLAGGEYEFPSRDRREFLAKVEGRRGWLAEPVASGNGVDLGFLYERYSVGTGALSNERYVYGDLIVEAPIPPAPVQPVTLMNVHAGSEAGPSYATETIWLWNEVHAGLFQASLATPDGHVTTLTSPVVPDPVVQSTILLARGEGSGAAALDLSLQAVGTPTLFPQLLVVAYLHLDATLSSLVGEPVEGQSRAFGPLPGLAQEDVLRMSAGSSKFQLPLP